MNNLWCWGKNLNYAKEKLLTKQKPSISNVNLIAPERQLNLIYAFNIVPRDFYLDFPAFGLIDFKFKELEHTKFTADLFKRWPVESWNNVAAWLRTKQNFADDSLYLYSWLENFCWIYKISNQLSKLKSFIPSLIELNEFLFISFHLQSANKLILRRNFWTMKSHDATNSAVHLFCYLVSKRERECLNVFDWVNVTKRKFWRTCMTFWFFKNYFQCFALCLLFGTQYLHQKIRKLHLNSLISTLLISSFFRTRNDIYSLLMIFMFTF